MLVEQLRYTSKVKADVSLKLNQTARHEDVFGEWRYSFTHWWPRH